MLFWIAITRTANIGFIPEFPIGPVIAKSAFVTIDAFGVISAI